MNLSWPQSVQYQAEEDTPAVSTSNGNQVAEPSDADTQTHVTTYNGVPRELLRKAQTVVGDEIRVFDLRRGSREDPLVGSLRKVRLSDPIVYEPLSYTWTDYDDAKLANGDAKYEAIQTIFLENADTFMNIGTNCEKALRSVRKSTTERRIWVDAICVNQDDPEERSRQVDLMRKIFARAFTVLVYLGQESMLHRSSMAMSLLGQPDRLRDFDGLNVDERSSLFFLFRRPYFQRMWIVQEVALAPTLEMHCGPAVTYLSAFAEKPLEAIFGSGIAHPPWLKHAKYTAGTTRGAPTTGMPRAEHVLRLLFDTVSCNCKDDRDRVFALLSLLQSNEEEWLRADYNLSTTQVYTGIAAFLATNGLGWAVLMLAPRLAPNGHSDLPSWVPNWKVLGDAGLEGPALLDHMITQSQNFKLGVVSSVTRSGAIAVRGKILGPVTASDCGLAYMAEYRDPMRKFHQADVGYFNGSSGPGVSSLRFTGHFTWTLAKPAQSPFDDSWECHIESGLRRMPPRNAQYLAVMLEDKKTVLILKQDDSTRDQYTLVEIGMPLVWGVIPRDWAWDESGQCIELPLQRLSMSALDDCRLHDIPLSPERFPRLWNYPHLWGYNPSTSSMSLKHKAVHYILSTDWTALNLWVEWQKQALVGIQILSDKTRLRHLIDELHGLRGEDYKQIEVQPELGSSWALDDFLSLFIKDPLKAGPMEWPGTQLGRDQSYEEAATLPLLMQWAATTHRFLVHLRPNDKSGITWLLTTDPPKIEDPYPAAIAVARTQRSKAPAFTNGHETSGSERAAFLLQKIMQQSSESMEPVHDQEKSAASSPRLYWDWKRFEFSVEQALFILRDIQPDIELLGSCLNSPTPDILRAEAHQLLAAHGVELKNDYTKIRVK